ncbi:class I SAM-dependent methyltransferase [Deltaproteobacteria bacterium]|nr:class I SAM-dependent methyltransferase [Deltaproteobacteria bacterium]
MVAKRSHSTKEHWQSVYSLKSAQEVGWFQAQHEVSIEFINNSGIIKDARILDVGSGATTLLDDLLDEGYSNIVAMDISASALAVSRKRLADLITWEVADITYPLDIEENSIDLWHDRAVLHFFTSNIEKQGYLKNLKRVVKRGGFVIIETFSPEGAPQCSGLDLQRYDEEMLEQFLGSDFELILFKRHVHSTPSGAKRPYVSTLFKRRE